MRLMLQTVSDGPYIKQTNRQIRKQSGGRESIDIITHHQEEGTLQNEFNEVKIRTPAMPSGHSPCAVFSSRVAWLKAVSAPSCNNMCSQKWTFGLFWMYMYVTFFSNLDPMEAWAEVGLIVWSRHATALKNYRWIIFSLMFWYSIWMISLSNQLFKEPLF